MLQLLPNTSLPADCWFIFIPITESYRRNHTKVILTHIPIRTKSIQIHPNPANSLLTPSKSYQLNYSWIPCVNSLSKLRQRPCKSSSPKEGLGTWWIPWSPHDHEALFTARECKGCSLELISFIQLHFIFKIKHQLITLPKFNIAPENLPSQ